MDYQLWMNAPETPEEKYDYRLRQAMRFMEKNGRPAYPIEEIAFCFNLEPDDVRKALLKKAYKDEQYNLVQCADVEGHIERKIALYDNSEYMRAMDNERRLTEFRKRSEEALKYRRRYSQR